MSEIHFAEPQYAHALWVVLAFVGLLYWLDLRGGTALDGLVAPSLQARLVQRPGAWRRRLRIALLGGAAACAVLALMRPQWGMHVVPASRAGAEIMIALDVSRSMLAEDVAPNRLERAKAEIVDLLSYLDGDQVGLIAFAGRASVLSPLTPDFGFLRLVLDGTGPGSVTRGGTKLAEPIRKAVAGFGPAEGAARAILLITDGEDHDSFALDAAKEAAAAGVKIIAIGFGDENGSEIRITDPRTGARTLLRDAAGHPVRSRLDGDLLRELALATDGAYVPAGTGVLDLASIYEQHIARLTRGKLEGTRTVRDEGYAWFVLLSLVLLVSSAAVSAGRIRGAAAAAVLALLLASPRPALAQAAAEPETAAGQAGSAAAGGSAPAADAAAADGAAPEANAQEPPADPRTVYNEAVAAMSRKSWEDAERLLTRARRDAGSDDELRFDASYNLGWVSVQQAGRLQGDSPKQALDLLYRGADWFREAVRMRPDDDPPRRNLEVTLKRALVLADELARNAEGGVEGALAELAQRERGVVAGVAGLLESTGGDASAAADGGDAVRGAFRAQATAQRTVLADADQLATRVGDERDGIQARPADQRTPQDAMRAAQLSNVLAYLHQARERMGQARSQLRQRQASRAYRRTSGALTLLKRAADQLRDPVAVLDQLLADGSETARGTALVALSQREIPGLADKLPPVPAWLSVEGLADDQGALAERTDELRARFAAGLEHAAAADASQIPPEQVEMLAAVREAEPLVGQAAEAARAAASALTAGTLDDVPESQRRSLEALGAARERFLDVRGLIEALYQDEKQIADVVRADDPQAVARREEFVPAVRTAQERNLERATRLAGKLADRQARVEAQAKAAAEAPADPQADPKTRPPDPARLEQDRKHLEIATQVLALATDAMQGVDEGLGHDAQAPPPKIDWEWVRSDSAKALDHIDTLRRLFFSITEHLRDVAMRQVELADRTQDALAKASAKDADATAEAAPLVDVEKGLADQTLVIANALEEQSNDAGGAAAKDPQAAGAGKQLREAADHVLLAQGRMEGATGSLGAPTDLPAARAAQDVAIDELQKALAILEPPKSDPQQGDSQKKPGKPQQQQQQQAQSQQQKPGADGQGGQPKGEKKPKDADAPAVDPGQLLQEVRDREAQRRHERAGRQQQGYDTVEKDW